MFQVCSNNFSSPNEFFKRQSDHLQFPSKLSYGEENYVDGYIPEHRANTIRLDIFEFCFDYLGNQNPRPLAIGGIFAGYHWSGTNSKSDLKTVRIPILISWLQQSGNSYLGLLIYTYLSWIGSCRAQAPNEALKSVCSSHQTIVIAPNWTSFLVLKSHQ